MQLITVTLVCLCVLLISGGVSGGLFSKKKSASGSETNKVAPVAPTQGQTSTPVIEQPSTPQLKGSGKDKPTGPVNYDYDLLSEEIRNANLQPKKNTKPILTKGTKKVGKKVLLPEDTSDHPVQIVSDSESVQLPQDDGAEDLHIVPHKTKKKPGQTSADHEAESNGNTVAVITEEKLDAAVDKIKHKQDHSYNKDPQLQDLIKRAKEVKSERAYLKKLVLAYSATQAFLSATDVIPFRDPVIFSVIKIVTYLKNMLQKPLSERYAEHQRVYSDLVTEMLKNDPKYSQLIKKKPKKLVIKTKDGKDIVVDIINEKALKEENLNLQNMNFVSLFRTGMQMKK